MQEGIVECMLFLDSRYCDFFVDVLSKFCEVHFQTQRGMVD